MALSSSSTAYRRMKGFILPFGVHGGNEGQNLNRKDLARSAIECQFKYLYGVPGQPTPKKLKKSCTAGRYRRHIANIKFILLRAQGFNSI